MSSKLGGIIALIIIIIAGAVWYVTLPAEEPTVQAQPEVLQEEQVAEIASSSPITEEDAGLASQQYQISTGSAVEYRIDEVLRGEDVTVIGKTDQVSGKFTVTLTDLQATQADPIMINARTLATDSGGRDNAVKRFVLNTDTPEHEFIVFAPTVFVDFPAGDFLPDTTVTGTIIGDLTISGTTNEVRFPATITHASSGAIQIVAEQAIAYERFGLTIPDVPFVADVADEITLAVSLIAEPVE